MRIFIVIYLAHLIDVCMSDKHTYGDLREGFDYKLHETVLIDSKSNEPKSYVIIFKYFASFLKSVGHIEIDINSPSTGSIDAIKANQSHPYLDVQLPVLNFYAKIHINDTKSCKATMKIFKSGTYTYVPSFGNLEATKSITIVYAKNASSAQNQFAQNQSIGRRENGDKLIHFESRNVTNTSRFPSRSIEYAGEHYITYVGFSFNSPTAMVLVNTTFVSEKEFNAVVYDMNTEHFVANVSVYGMKITPENRIGVISLM